jgi:hypothetical protein
MYSSQTAIKCHRCVERLLVLTGLFVNNGMDKDTCLYKAVQLSVNSYPRSFSDDIARVFKSPFSLQKIVSSAEVAPALFTYS